MIFIHVMVAAGVCFGEKERLHLIQNKTKVNNAKLYLETLLLELVQDWLHLSVHTTKLAQDCIATNCSEFIGKDE